MIDAVQNDRVLAAENILQKLRDPLTIFFFQFLQLSLPFFTKINREMQSEKPKIQELHSNVTAMYKTLLECYIKRQIILKTPVHQINYENPHNFRPLNEIYLGAQIAMRIDNLDQNQAHILRTRCLDFFIEGATQINQRFDFNSEVLKNMNIINPSTPFRRKI
ncbi:hypothetical protein NQ314_005733 [Rhamnusium bicolor]|uniref:Uncharacterized protein n=1 Tax=Rhamnusium bicolor TaxID=1586634 RepID=A0AAV8ZFV2_9CUCU|nr:hypothetical protein NQ314_005733 [Rhamnusium bicolor]